MLSVTGNTSKRLISSASASCQMPQVSSGVALDASEARAEYSGLSTHMKFRPPWSGVAPSKNVDSTTGPPGATCTQPVSQSNVDHSCSDHAAASFANSSVVTPSSSHVSLTSSAAAACVEVG